MHNSADAWPLVKHINAIFQTVFFLIPLDFIPSFSLSLSLSHAHNEVIFLNLKYQAYSI